MVGCSSGTHNSAAETTRRFQARCSGPYFAYAGARCTRTANARPPTSTPFSPASTKTGTTMRLVRRHPPVPALTYCLTSMQAGAASGWQFADCFLDARCGRRYCWRKCSATREVLAAAALGPLYAAGNSGRRQRLERHEYTAAAVYNAAAAPCAATRRGEFGPLVWRRRAASGT
jgi:hypothetical protein